MYRIPHSYGCITRRTTIIFHDLNGKFSRLTAVPPRTIPYRKLKLGPKETSASSIHSVNTIIRCLNRQTHPRFALPNGLLYRTYYAPYTQQIDRGQGHRDKAIGAASTVKNGHFKVHPTPPIVVAKRGWNNRGTTAQIAGPSTGYYFAINAKEQRTLVHALPTWRHSRRKSSRLIPREQVTDFAALVSMRTARSARELRAAAV